MKKGGFTLIELLVVISIIGMLSSIVLASIQSKRYEAEGVAEGARARQYIFALESYVTDTGKFPTFEPENMTLAACLGDSPVCHIVEGSAFILGHHPVLDAIMNTYAPNIGDVNKNVLDVVLAPDTLITSRSMYYQCETGNVEMTECLWATITWYTRGKSCGVQGSRGWYSDFGKVSVCQYQLGDDPFN